MSSKLSRVSAYIDIEGVGKVDVIGLTATYDIDSIPTCTVTLPAGWDARTRKQPYKNLRKRLTTRTKVDVYLSVDPVGYVGAPTTKKIFSGYTSSLATRRDSASIGVELGLVHWLSDFNDTPALSDRITPGEMDNISQPMAAAIASATDNNLVTAGGIATAIAESSTLPEIFSIVSNALYIFSGTTFRSAEGDRKAAVAALLDGKPDTDAGDIKNDLVRARLPQLVGYLPLAFNASTTTYTGISQAIASAFMPVFSGNSFWGALNAITQQFGGVIIPRVDDTLFMPRLPVASQFAAEPKNIELSGEDYTYVEVFQESKTPHSGIRVRAPTSLATTTTMTGPVRSPVALYALSSKVQGVVGTVDMPEWIAITAAYELVALTYAKGMFGRINFNRKSGKLTVPELTRLEQGASALREEIETAGESERYEQYIDKHQFASLGTLYAQMILNERNFEGTRATVRGPFRFDVCPGSNIILKIPESAGIGIGFGDDDYVSGYLSGVTISVNATNNELYQDYRITHIKSETDSSYAPFSHPLYRQFMLNAGMAGSVVYV